LGYRNQVTNNALIDLALFSDYYEHLVGYDLARFYLTTESGATIANVPTANNMKGEVHGVELSGDIRLKDWWKIKTYYSFTKMSLAMEKGFSDVGLPKLLNAATPVHTSYVRSSFDLPHAVEFDVTFRYTSTYYVGSIPSVAEVDFNLTKKFGK